MTTCPCEEAAEEPFDEVGPPPICPVTGMYCDGEFCEDYGCAKKAGVWDDEDDYL